MPKIRSYSETRPYSSIAAFSDVLYAGTSNGVVSFNQRTGEIVRLTEKEGLPSSQVSAMSGHSGSGLWVATSSGISRLHNGVWTNVVAKELSGRQITSMAATSWGVWVGGPWGLGRLKDGQWKEYLPSARVSHLMADLSGNGLWIGTDGEGIYQFHEEKLISHSPASGQVIRRVLGMTHTPSGGLLAIGQDESRSRMTFFDGAHWTAYTPSPAGDLRWIHQLARGVLLAHNDRLFLLKQIDAPHSSTMQQDLSGPVHLSPSRSPKAPPGYPVIRFTTEPLDRWLPPRPTRVVGFGRHVLIGTRAMGLLLYDGTQVSWYRTNDLVGDLEKLHVACDPKACYMANGTGQAYRFDGRTFEPVDVDPDPAVKILTLVNNPSGDVISIHSSADGRSLVAKKLSGDSFSPMFSAEIAIPKGSIGVRFSRFDPEGKLWLGLSYVEEDGAQRPWGIVVMGMSGADVMYHRSTLMPGEKRPKGSLALPDDIRDIQFFGGYAWLSTGAGACRVKGNQVLLYTENEGLESEIIHRFVFRPNGEILAATHGGVGRFDGKVWRFNFDDPLRQPTRALLLENGALWAGTSRGLVIQNDRGETRLIDSTEGLIGNVIKDLKKDPLGRLWVLTDQGLSIIDRVP